MLDYQRVNATFLVHLLLVQSHCALPLKVNKEDWTKIGAWTRDFGLQICRFVRCLGYIIWIYGIPQFSRPVTYGPEPELIRFILRHNAGPGTLGDLQGSSAEPARTPEADGWGTSKNRQRLVKHLQISINPSKLAVSKLAWWKNMWTTPRETHQ